MGRRDTSNNPNMTEKGNYEMKIFFDFSLVSRFHPFVLSNEMPLLNVFVNVWLLEVIRHHTVF
jgi:hypothetical protein